MNLTLRVNGEDRIFSAPFVSARHFRKLMEFDEVIDYTDLDVKSTDKLVGFVCEVFDNQFTIDEFYDGIPSHQLMSTILDVFVYVRTGKEPSELADEGNEQGK